MRHWKLTLLSSGMISEYKDRVILVTGAAQGLGFSYSRCLAEQGAIVAMHDGGVDLNGLNPDPDIIVRAARKITNGCVFPISGLLQSKEDCSSLVKNVIEKYGRIDGLINNAGVVIWENTSDVDLEIFRSSSVINHEVPFWLCQEVLPLMQAQGFGRIVLTSSGWALGPYPGSEKLALYCQSKGAQFGFGMALANGTGHPDIKVNIVAPIANTRIYASEVEVGKLRPESVAGTVAWLVSPKCNINGRLLKVADGNISILEMSEVGSIFLGTSSDDPVACGKAISMLLKDSEHITE